MRLAALGPCYYYHFVLIVLPLVWTKISSASLICTHKWCCQLFSSFYDHRSRAYFLRLCFCFCVLHACFNMIFKESKVLSHNHFTRSTHNQRCVLICKFNTNRWWAKDDNVAQPRSACIIYMRTLLLFYLMRMLQHTFQRIYSFCSQSLSSVLLSIHIFY